MPEPAMPQKAPYPVELQPGDYWWCQCGQSKRQPFCDGSHKGSGFTPIQFTLTAPDKKWMCGCKRSGNKPFCDGTHKTL
jgi:CDGSH iron-sulfur domain-containing protein 3